MHFFDTFGINKVHRFVKLERKFWLIRAQQHKPVGIRDFKQSFLVYCFFDNASTLTSSANMTFWLRRFSSFCCMHFENLQNECKIVKTKNDFSYFNKYSYTCRFCSGARSNIARLVQT